MPLQLRGGETFSPSQVYLAGRGPPFTKAGLVSVKSALPSFSGGVFDFSPQEQQRTRNPIARATEKNWTILLFEFMDKPPLGKKLARRMLRPRVFARRRAIEVKGMHSREKNMNGIEKISLAPLKGVQLLNPIPPIHPVLSECLLPLITKK
jgi:hypothetical protein